MALGEFSVVVSIIGVVPYIGSIICGSVRPARMSWFVWTVILALGLWGYRAAGAGDSAWLLFGDLLITFVVFACSLWRGSGGWDRLDACCLVIAVAGIGLWQLSGDAVLGVCGTLLADAVALVPTLHKALHDPLSESPTTYGFSAAASLLGTLAVGKWNLWLLAYPAYLFLANFTTTLVIWVSQYQLRHIQEQPMRSPRKSHVS